MSAPVLTNVRLITILAASLLAGYAGDEALNAWWGRSNRSPATEVVAQSQPVTTVARADMPALSGG